MNLYGFRTDGDYPLSILKFSPMAKEMEKLEGLARRLGGDVDFPTEFHLLCRELNVEDRRARETSDSLQLRFARSDAMQKSLSKRHLVQRALEQLTDSKAGSSPQLLSELDAALRESGFSPLEPGITEDNSKSRHDPYVLSWHAEIGLGPALTFAARDILRQIAKDRMLPLSQRKTAFSLMCRIGWNPSENSVFRTLHNDLRTALELKQDRFDSGIHWQLVDTRP